MTCSKQVIMPLDVQQVLSRLQKDLLDYELDDPPRPYLSSYDEMQLCATRVVKDSFDSGTSVDGSGDSDVDHGSQVVLRASRHVSRLEQEFRLAQDITAASDPDGMHFCRPLHLVHLPSRTESEVPLAVAIFMVSGRQSWYERTDLLPTNDAAHGSEPGQAPISLFIDFAIAACECCEVLHHGHHVTHGELRGDAFRYDAEAGKVHLMNLGCSTTRRKNSLAPETRANIVRDAWSDYKLQYVAPEQTGRLAVQPDFRTDIWALGILFWMMLTGQKEPFAGKTPSDIVQNILAAPLPTVSSIRLDCPPVLGKAISKMTAKAIESRYNTVLAVKHDLVEMRRCMMEGDESALSRLEVGTTDFSCVFTLPTHLTVRENHKRAIVESVISNAASFDQEPAPSKEELRVLRLGSWRAHSKEDGLIPLTRLSISGDYAFEEEVGR